MLAELESHRLEVVLVPLNPKRRGYNEGGCKRVCADRNPCWYRQLCSDNPSSRRVRRGGFDTKIKRFNTLRALAQLIAGQPAGKYGPALQVLARARPSRAKSTNPF